MCSYIWDSGTQKIYWGRAACAAACWLWRLLAPVGYLQRCIYCVFEREEAGWGRRIRVEGELGLEAAAQRREWAIHLLCIILCVHRVSEIGFRCDSRSLLVAFLFVPQHTHIYTHIYTGTHKHLCTHRLLSHRNADADVSLSLRLGRRGGVGAAPSISIPDVECVLSIEDMMLEANACARDLLCTNTSTLHVCRFCVDVW